MFIYRINTGSCNACDVELLATSFVPKFNFKNLELKFTNNPKEANIILVTGPITARSAAFLQKTLAQTPKEKIVLAMGICPVSCGVFRDSYSICGPLDKFVAVDINIPGCPPTPQAIIQSFEYAKKLWQQKYASRNKNAS